MTATARGEAGRPPVDDDGWEAVAELYRNLAKLKDAGLTILLTEQQVPLALALTDRAYVLEQGAIRLSGRSAELAGDPGIKRAYLGLA